MPAVEGFGVEPIPPELRTVGWRDLFAINFAFLVNPVMYVVGALAVVDGGLPLPWALAASVLGQALAFGLLVVVAQPAVDDGLAGQVSMRASLGHWGARLLSSPYRIVAATYWFAAQALAGALGIQAVVVAMGGSRPPLVPVALGLAAAHATLAVLGFDVMRYVLRVVLPLSIVFTGVLLVLYVGSDDPRFAVSRVLESPEQHLTWTGFATYVTVVCGAQLTLVTSVADLCRYTPTRRDLRIGLVASAVLAIVATTLVGGYAAAATGELNPFIAVTELTSVDALLVVLLAAVVVQGAAANITNVYTAGLSLVNAAPALGRVRATLVVAAGSIALSAFPDVIEQAERWIAHLGGVGAALTGVVLADYLFVKRGRIDVEALFARAGAYRYARGFNVAAVVAVAAGVAVYEALPRASLAVVWGLVVAAVVYLAALPAQQTLLARPHARGTGTEAA